MRTSVGTFAVVVLLALVGSGCGGGGASGSGNVQTQTRTVPAFDSIDFSSAGTVTIEQTGTDSLQVQADDNLQPLLTSEVTGTTLKLGLQPESGIGDARNINYRITVRQLRGVVLSGAGSIDATRIDTPYLSLANAGAGRLTAAGRAERQNIDLVGLGMVDSSGLVSQEADVSVSGAGQARVDAIRTLTARVTGVGSIKYRGNPAVTQTVTGLGTISRG